VAVPSRVERVYAAGPPASVLVLALAPQKLIGWTRAPRPAEAALLPEAMSLLPELGRLTGRGNTANVEVIMRARPDLILDVGSTSATFVTLAERVEQQSGIPYLLFDGTLAETPRLLRQVGRAIGAADTAEMLARDAEAQLREVAARIDPLPQDERPRVYFARGPTGLTTAPRGSMQAEALALAGGYNVIAAPAGFIGNLVNVSLEDVFAARPDVIVASDPAFAATVTESPAWRGVPAVRAAGSTPSPAFPSAGSIRPPCSIACSASSGWCGFCMRLFPEPLGPRITAFHARYYHREPTDAQVRALLDVARMAR
jgi:iron complex transport system substrate-binding protein